MIRSGRSGALLVGLALTALALAGCSEKAPEKKTAPPTLITASSTATAMPVANVHSRPLFAILHTAHTAMIGALISIIRPMVTNI